MKDLLWRSAAMEGSMDPVSFLVPKDKIDISIWVSAPQVSERGSPVLTFSQVNGYAFLLPRIWLECLHGTMTRAGLAYNIAWYFYQMLKVRLIQNIFERLIDLNPSLMLRLSRQRNSCYATRFRCSRFQTSGLYLCSTLPPVRINGFRKWLPWVSLWDRPTYDLLLRSSPSGLVLSAPATILIYLRELCI